MANPDTAPQQEVILKGGTQSIGGINYKTITLNENPGKTVSEAGAAIADVINKFGFQITKSSG